MCDIFYCRNQQLIEFKLTHFALARSTPEFVVIAAGQERSREEGGFGSVNR